MRDDLDRFYTKPEVARQCISTVRDLITPVYNGIEDFITIEPSAGGGAFSNQIDGCYAYDLSPSDPRITRKNWLEVKKEDFPDNTKKLIIGNPPFGNRSSLAKRFIKHSIRIDPAVIAFILPSTFNKRINQKVFPENWRLVGVKGLDRDESVFSLVDSGDIFIPCDFFVWTNDPLILPETDLRKKAIEVPKELSFVSRGSMDADFAINGNSGKVKRIEEITNPKAEHYIKVNEGYDKEAIILFLQNLPYQFHSSVNGGVAWINKEDISETFNMAKTESGTIFQS